MALAAPFVPVADLALGPNSPSHVYSMRCLAGDWSVLFGEFLFRYVAALISASRAAAPPPPPSKPGLGPHSSPHTFLSF